MIIECKIEERGNGWPNVGDYCAGGGELFRVVSIESTIHTPASPGAPEWRYGAVEWADWEDCPESDQHSAAVVALLPSTMRSPTEA